MQTLVVVYSRRGKKGREFDQSGSLHLVAPDAENVNLTSIVPTNGGGFNSCHQQKKISRARTVMWSRSTDGPPGLRMKSGTTGSVSSRSDRSAASSHSTLPSTTTDKWDVFLDAINRKKISRIRMGSDSRDRNQSFFFCLKEREIFKLNS